MTTFMARAKLRQVLALMKEERKTLLNGPLENLVEIAEKRNTVLAALEKGGPVARSVLGSGMQEIRNLAVQNKKLFEASAKGMRAARDALRVLEKNLGAMETYTSQGEKIVVMQNQPAKDHKV